MVTGGARIPLHKIDFRGGSRSLVLRDGMPRSEHTRMIVGHVLDGVFPKCLWPSLLRALSGSDFPKASLASLPAMRRPANSGQRSEGATRVELPIRPCVLPISTAKTTRLSHCGTLAHELTRAHHLAPRTPGCLLTAPAKAAKIRLDIRSSSALASSNSRRVQYRVAEHHLKAGSRLHTLRRADDTVLWFASLNGFKNRGR